MPRPGPRRPLLAGRVDEADKDWVEAQAERESVGQPEFFRRVVSFARLHMPEGWTKPAPETPAPTQETEPGVERGTA